MDDWKLKARTTVKLEEDINLFVSLYLLFLFIVLPFNYFKLLLHFFPLLNFAQVINLFFFILFFSTCRSPGTPPQTSKVKFYFVYFCTTASIMTKCTANHLKITLLLSVAHMIIHRFHAISWKAAFSRMKPDFTECVKAVKS